MAKKPKRGQVSAAISGQATVTSQLQMLVFVNLARYHLRSACGLARFAYPLERGSSAHEPGMEREEHDTFLVAALIFAGAFVDGEINSLYAMAAEASQPDALPMPMRGPVRDDMAAFFAGKQYRGMGTIPKYQHLLELAGTARLPTSGAERTNVRRLLGIRNALVHYGQGPVLTSTGGPAAAPMGQFEGELSALGISRSPWASVNDPFFPRSMLSHQLAATAIDWAVAWVDAFYAQLGVTTSPLDAMRADIRTGP